MGLSRAKIRVIQLAAAAVALLALPAYSQSINGVNDTMNRAPASEPNDPTTSYPPTSDMRYYGQGAAKDCKDNPGKCSAAADAFTTAGEQATFLGAYQMSFGPYGSANGTKEDREKMIRETAKAIDDCLNGRACNNEKQEKVLKALVQYNMGQDIKMMMLTNNTNREKMKSLDYAADPTKKANHQGYLNQAEIEASLGRGKSVSVDQTDPIKPYQVSKEAALTRTTGSTKDEFFQLAEEKVNHSIDAEYMQEREILGEKFLNDYGAFLDGFATTEDKHERRFYKYVPSKADSNVYVYDESQSGISDNRKRFSVNQERFAEVQSEQQNPNVRKALADYKGRMTKIEGRQGEDGKVQITSEGSSPQELGIGEMANIDPSEWDGVDFKDLMQDGKITDANRARAVARVINTSIVKAGKDKQQEEEKSRKLASGASADNPKWIHNVVLSPESFDQFLDEIWPTSAKRRELMSSAPSIQAPAAKQPEETKPDYRDEYGRKVNGEIQPTDGRFRRDRRHWRDRKRDDRYGDTPTNENTDSDSSNSNNEE